jgi:hypothetical protein
VKRLLVALVLVGGGGFPAAQAQQSANAAATPAPAPATQAAPPAPSQQQSPPPRRESYSDRYSILTQRNIFLKDRSRGGSRNGSTTGPTTSSASQPQRRSPEETLLLRGIVIEEGEVRAYFEDIVNSRIVRVGQGDTIARGRIASIDLDLVEYEPTAGAGAKRTFVVVGHDLTGKVSALDTGMTGEGGDAAMATTGPVMPSGVAGLNPNDPNLTPEQKMKLRRAMELKK